MSFGENKSHLNHIIQQTHAEYLYYIMFSATLPYPYTPESLSQSSGYIFLKSQGRYSQCVVTLKLIF
jgi:hypothetical protein